MSYYDPEVVPDPKTWLATDEGERIRVVENFHVASRIKLPNVIAHAALHVMVENQVAADFGPSIRAMARLQSEGLSRHDAIHAVAAVFVKLYRDLLDDQNASESGAAQAHADFEAQYSAALETLSAAQWFREFGS